MDKRFSVEKSTYVKGSYTIKDNKNGEEYKLFSKKERAEQELPFISLKHSKY